MMPAFPIERKLIKYRRAIASPRKEKAPPQFLHRMGWVGLEPATNALKRATIYRVGNFPLAEYLPDRAQG
jgi:hypothetical protein